MTLEEAKAALATCVRNELRDHAFSDREVHWEREGETVAEGYFGLDASHVAFVGSDAPAFTGDAARALARCGRLGAVERNDAGGGDLEIDDEDIAELEAPARARRGGRS